MTPGRRLPGVTPPTPHAPAAGSAPAASAEPRHLELDLPGGPVTLGYVEEGPICYLAATERSARWPTEVLRAGLATVRVGGVRRGGEARLVLGPEDRGRVRELFRAKYAPGEFDRYYAGAARFMRIDLSGAAAEAEGAQARYRRWVAAEFDDLAPEYEGQIRGNRISRLLRERSLALLRPTFGEARRLLEIGCGSGVETLPMLLDGHEIVCVDLSTAMLEVVRRRARTAGVSERLETRTMAAGELGQLVRELGTASFDGAYSTYGALNCEEDLAPVARALAELLPEGRRFVAGAYNRWCLVELLGYGLTGQWGRALGRRRRPIAAGASRYGVDLFAVSPGDLFRSFAPAFRATALEAAPAILPPFDLVKYAEKFARHFATLSRWDARIARTRPFSYLGDHFLAVLERTGAPGTVASAPRRTR